MATRQVLVEVEDMPEDTDRIIGTWLVVVTAEPGEGNKVTISGQACEAQVMINAPTYDRLWNIVTLDGAEGGGRWISGLPH